MNFSFTPEQEALRKAAREFAEKEIDPMVKWMEEKNEVPIDLARKLCSQFGAFLIPEEYGGGAPHAGMGHTARTIVLEEVGRISGAMAQLLQVHHLGEWPIIMFGSEEQKKRFLPDLASGRKIAGLAVTEPYGGSDIIGAIRTTAKREGDEYILNGMKIWITSSHIADVVGVIARTGEGSKGLTCFILEKGMKGFEPYKVHKEVGLRGCNVGAFLLKDVRVPVENRIGNEGDGLKIALHSISNVGRPGVAATALGITRRCLEESVKYAQQRTLYGKPIVELQAIQWHLTDLYMDYEISRLLVYYAAWLRDQNLPPLSKPGARVDAENALAKFWSVEAAIRCARKTIDIYGAYGVELVPQRLLRDALSLIASAGTQEIMRLLMVRKALEISKQS